ncbi:MAG: divergent polysaccharide deacetylase family protein [Acidobacteriia bacterium]|nr:divergent polysaccharide deacetylase family protein [Terriglobia bacterium]
MGRRTAPPLSAAPDVFSAARLFSGAPLFFALALLFLACLAGCRKPEERLRASRIHAITRELASAAASAAPRGTDIRSNLRAAESRPDTPDHLYITLRADGSEAARRAALARVLQALGAVATRHGLTQEPRAESGGLLRFDYRRGGALTHTIHVIWPIAARANSAAAPKSALGDARLAIILDDLGQDRAAADAIFALPYPLTLSVLPDHPHSAEIAEEAHSRGYQVMLHLPMQSLGEERPEPAELRPGLPSGEVAALVARMLDSVPNVAGVNNHQGSQATADPALMDELMPVLRERHLFFIDSRTTAATVAYETAQRSGLPAAFRNVPFLDDVAEVSAVRAQLELAIRTARSKGEAIAIGHPHPATLQALGELLPQLEAQGVRLVFASELVH